MAGFLQGGVGLRGLLGVFGLLAGIGMVAGWYGEYAWWLDMWVHFKGCYVAIFLLLAIVQACDRRWLYAAGATGLAIVNLMPLWPYLAGPGTAGEAPGPGVVVRAMMANVNTFYGDASRVAGAIRHERPDILLLIEVDRGWLSKLEPELAAFPNRLLEPRDDNFGIALFSKLPLDAARVVFIGKADVPSVQARVAVGDDWACFLGTHLPPPAGERLWELRNDQFGELARHVRGMIGPLLVLGDFNATPWSYHFGRFMDATGLEDSARGRRLMGTWPTFARPFSIPIDHCLYRDGIVIRGRRHGSDVGSDHVPVIVDFCLAR